MSVGLALGQWGDIAQFVIAITAGLALVVAGVELWRSRTNARRVRAYQYSDRLNQLEMRRMAGEYRKFFEDEKHTFEDFMALDRVRRNELLMLPNLIEEIAALYHRKLIDRNVAAEVVGVYVEQLWTASKAFIIELRSAYGSSAFDEWERMAQDTAGRKLKVDRKITRRRAIRMLVRGY
jgi:hypothetical protein